MPPPQKHVAIAGATGSLAPHIIAKLLRSEHTITLLTRNASLTDYAPNLTIRTVDFISVPSLVSALKGVEVMVSCVATAAIAQQGELVEAAKEAGVRHFIPAEFGMDSTNDRAGRLPVVCAAKVAVREILANPQNGNGEEEGGGGGVVMTWTSLCNGLFLDWGLRYSFILDIGNRTAKLYDGGDVPFSATTLSDVAKAVWYIVENYDVDERVRNKVLHVQSAVVTQKQLLGIAKDVLAERGEKAEWTVERKSVEDVRKQSLELLEGGNKEDVERAVEGLCVVGSWGEGYGGCFGAKGERGNGVVGIEMLGQDGLKGAVEGVVREFCGV
ncbi:NAD(P)-binding protein [Periconia macrospinosa]|uniref:NAD(P)-binding protein n=1 Tax=Periconia macrospinosa TaxID=97972 RepID=A0A2V1DFA9_9PLEO|nr:NAD(P)-binding protein [Periconia macrospinosa]